MRFLSSKKKRERTMLRAINVMPRATNHCSPVPKPVAARVVGAAAVAPVGALDAGDDDVPDAAAVAGPGAGAGDAVAAEPVDAVVGDGVGEVGAGVEGGVATDVGAEVGGGPVVGGAGAAATLTTANPPTPLPATWPAEVSPTKV
jgi:hypothetical protein